VAGFSGNDYAIVHFWVDTIFTKKMKLPIQKTTCCIAGKAPCVLLPDDSLIVTTDASE